MNKRREHRMRNGLVFLPFLFLIFCFVHCNDDNDSKAVHDPSKPVEFITYSPDSGGVGTQMIIEGSNFGSDTALVKVAVNGKNARVIGVSDTRIYAVVPSRADVGAVSVSIGDPENPKTHTFDNEFRYLFRQNVTTYTGQTSSGGDGDYIDGNLAEAWFKLPCWLRFDNDGILYVMEWGDGNPGGIRIIENGIVSNPLRVRGSINKIRSIDFSLAQDTMFLTNDTWDDRGVGTVTLNRADGFMTFRNYVFSKTTNFGAINPVDGEYFYNTYHNGEILRWDKQKGEGVTQFITRDGDYEQHMVFTNDGKTAYIIVKNRHFILKADYDFATKTLSAPVELAGQVGSAGFADGIGSEARFDNPSQPVVDEDNNLYVADRSNHCIRKITPQGVVSTYAGVPRQSGYLDGEPLKALFKDPEGLAFGPDGGLYVADKNNHRIRKILIE